MMKQLINKIPHVPLSALNLAGKKIKDNNNMILTSNTLLIYSPVALSQDSQQLYTSLPLSVSNDAVAPEILFY